MSLSSPAGRQGSPSLSFSWDFLALSLVWGSFLPPPPPLDQLICSQLPFLPWILCSGYSLTPHYGVPKMGAALLQLSDPRSHWQDLSGSSPKRRRAEDKDEGIGSPDIWEDEKAEDLRREMIELRQQLDKERSVRMMLEEQVREPLAAATVPLPRFLEALVRLMPTSIPA